MYECAHTFVMTHRFLPKSRVQSSNIDRITGHHLHRVMEALLAVEGDPVISYPKSLQCAGNAGTPEARTWVKSETKSWSGRPAQSCQWNLSSGDAALSSQMIVRTTVHLVTPRCPRQRTVHSILLRAARAPREPVAAISIRCRRPAVACHALWIWRAET